MSAAEIVDLQAAVRDIYVDNSVQEYILDLVSATRSAAGVALGASPRGSLSLLHASQARAALQGRDFVKPDDVKALAVAVLAHRLIVRPDQRVRGLTAAACIESLLKTVSVGG